MNDIEFVIKKGLKSIEISFTETYLDKYINKHPSPNSLLCISDVMDHYRVENTAGEFEDKSELQNYPGTHISQMRSTDNENYFVLVRDFDEKVINYFTLDDGDRIKTESLQDYFQKWTGIVLYISKIDNSGEPNYEKNQSKIKGSRNLQFGFISILILILGTYWLQSLETISNPFYFSSLLAIKIMGCIISELLISKYYLPNSKLASSICALGKNEGGCDHILFSKASKVTSFLSWSEVGLFYYLIGFISLILFQDQVYFILFILSIFCLPYSFWSIYHQYKIAKKWCILCLIIQSLFWIEFLVGIYFNTFDSYNFSLTTILNFGLVTVFIILLWYLIKPILERYKDYDGLEAQKDKFSQDSAIFQFLMAQVPETAYPDAKEFIQHGNITAPIHIGVVSSPICPGCKHALKILFDLYKNNADKIRLTEIYAVPMDGENEKKKIAHHILQYRTENGLEKFKSAIEEWYESEGDYEAWSVKYSIQNTKVDANDEILGYHRFAADKLGIEHTPTIFINYKKLSDKYRVEDIEHLILRIESAEENEADEEN